MFYSPSVSAFFTAPARMSWRQCASACARHSAASTCRGRIASRLHMRSTGRKKVLPSHSYLIADAVGFKLLSKQDLT